MKYRGLLLVVGVLLLTAVESAEVSLDDVLSGPVKTTDFVDKARLSMIRAQAMATGIAFGARQFLAENTELLRQRAKVLDQLDFGLLAFAPHTLPPVVVEADDFYEQEDDRSAHQVRRMYRIVRDARIVYQYPSWRDYLRFEVSDVDIPSMDLRLKTPREKATWREFAAKGVKIGRQTALAELEMGLAEMVRDYEGMLRALYLDRLGMLRLSRYEVLRNNAVVTDKALNMDDRILHLAEDDVFVAPPSRWRVFVREDADDGVEEGVRAVRNIACHFWPHGGLRTVKIKGCGK